MAEPKEDEVTEQPKRKSSAEDNPDLMTLLRHSEKIDAKLRGEEVNFEEVKAEKKTEATGEVKPTGETKPATTTPWSKNA